MTHLDRRQLLLGLTSAGAVALVEPAVAARPDRDRIRRENSLPGTTDWQLTYTRVHPTTKYRLPLARIAHRVTQRVSNSP